MRQKLNSAKSLLDLACGRASQYLKEVSPGLLKGAHEIHFEWSSLIALLDGTQVDDLYRRPEFKEEHEYFSVKVTSDRYANVIIIPMWVITKDDDSFNVWLKGSYEKRIQGRKTKLKEVDERIYALETELKSAHEEKTRLQNEE